MVYNSSNKKQLIKAQEYLNKLKNKNCRFEIKELKESRSNKQNRALHLFFSFISCELNNLGLQFQYQGLNTNFSLPYTPELVKNFVWRPLQIALFEIESTKDLNTEQINKIIDVLICFFGEKGVVLSFPSIEDLIK